MTSKDIVPVLSGLLVLCAVMGAAAQDYRGLVTEQKVKSVRRVPAWDWAVELAKLRPAGEATRVNLGGVVAMKQALAVERELVREFEYHTRRADGSLSLWSHPVRLKTAAAWHCPGADRVYAYEAYFAWVRATPEEPDPSGRGDNAFFVDTDADGSFETLLLGFDPPKPATANCP